jgi:hypothetical protein
MERIEATFVLVVGLFLSWLFLSRFERLMEKCEARTQK